MSSQNAGKHLLSKTDTVLIILIIVLVIMRLILTCIPDNKEIIKYIFELEQKIGFPLSLIIQLAILILFVILALKFIIRSYKKLEKHNKK